MPRRYRRRRYYPIVKSLRTKYSNETYGSIINLTNDTVGNRNYYACPIVPEIPAGTLGTRKIKNFTLKFKCLPSLQTVGQNDPTIVPTRILYALVFVPEGLNPSPINIGSENQPRSIYEPNQNVILSGLIDDEQVYTVKSRLSRNLNSGDRLYCIFMHLSTPIEGTVISGTVNFTCNYAIAF